MVNPNSGRPFMKTLSGFSLEQLNITNINIIRCRNLISAVSRIIDISKLQNLLV